MGGRLRKLQLIRRFILNWLSRDLNCAISILVGTSLLMMMFKYEIFQKLEPELEYFIELFATSHTSLYQYAPDPFRVDIAIQKITDLICKDQTTQIDIILEREPDDKLFAFHQGTGPELHVKWNRKGDITKENLKIK